MHRFPPLMTNSCRSATETNQMCCFYVLVIISCRRKGEITVCHRADQVLDTVDALANGEVTVEPWWKMNDAWLKLVK